MHFTSGGYPQVKGAIGNHCSFLVKEEAEKLQTPWLFNCAEKDQVFTPELRQHFESTLKQRNMDATFLDYPGTEHGFTIRPDHTEHGDQQMKKARQAVIEWINKRK